MAVSTVSTIVQGLLGTLTNFKLTAITYGVNSNTQLLADVLGAGSGGLPAQWNEEGDTFESHATVTEGYDLSSSTVSYPLEAGFPMKEMAGVTDFTVNINAINSNSFASPLDGLTDDPLAAVGALGGGLVGQLAGIKSRIQKAYDTLEKWASTGQPLSLRCIYAKQGYRDSSGQFAPFIITAFNISRDESTGDSIGYSLTLNRVFISRVSVTAGTAGQNRGEKGTTKKGTNPNGVSNSEVLKPGISLKEGFTHGDGSATENYYNNVDRTGDSNIIQPQGAVDGGN